ncbi:hypothetical protein ACET3X_008798 [Alternaria dauci]|uniref:Alpha/beta hydrolase fold-3 domain-containing protein n=1 Tax=Alternaria dauci TaxID=48095 RepID=A0ABR3U9I9_9PLEO
MTVNAPIESAAKAEPPIRPSYAPSLIPAVEAFGTTPPSKLTVEQLRSSPDGYSAKKILQAIPDLEHTEHSVPGLHKNDPPVTLSVFTRKSSSNTNRAVVYSLHGGAQITCTRFTALDAVMRYFAAIDTVFVAPEYRLSPEHPAPAALHDAYAGLQWVVAHTEELGIDPSRIVIQGNSGGAPIACGTAMLCRDNKNISLLALMLFAPMLDDRDGTVSSKQFANDGPWSGTVNRMAWDMVLGDQRGGTEVSELVAPARATDLHGPDELRFLHPDAWRDVYGHGDGKGKGTRGSVPPKDWVWGGLIAPNRVASILEEQVPEDHLRVRRIFEPAFSDRALKEQEPLFMKYVDQLVRNLRAEVREQPEKRFDMVTNYNFTSFDIMGDLTFGEPLHMLDESKYNPWVSLIFDSIRVTCRFNLIKQYPWLSRIVTANLPESARKTRQEHFQYSVDRVSKRIERGRTTEGRDLWDYALTQNKGKQLSRSQMDSNATAFMVAGTETTATLLSGLTYLLLKNPATMQKLSSEVRGAFADSSDMSMEAIAALPYLAA